MQKDLCGIILKRLKFYGKFEKPGLSYVKLSFIYDGIAAGDRAAKNGRPLNKTSCLMGFCNDGDL